MFSSPCDIFTGRELSQVLDLKCLWFALLSIFSRSNFSFITSIGLCLLLFNLIVVAVQSLSYVQVFATPWTAAPQASLSFTISWSLLKLMSIESVMPSNYLILCCPLLLPSIFPSIRVFSNESAPLIGWPKYWSFSISPSMNIQGWFPLGLTNLISVQSRELSRVFSNTTV